MALSTAAQALSCHPALSCCEPGRHSQNSGPPCASSSLHTPLPFLAYKRTNTVFSTSRWGCQLLNSAGLRSDRGLGRSSRKVRVEAGSGEELPPELQRLNEEDDGKFAKINQGDPAYGPPALLLFGFTPDEKVEVKGLLDEIGGDFMKIVQATTDTLDKTLWEAFRQVQDPNPSNLATEVPRMCFISGLTGEELMMLVDAFGKSKLRRPVFAALVPKNKDKLLRELIEEVMGDHRKLALEARPRRQEQQEKAASQGA